jgi:RNA polymerase sigma-70 factor (ECF subfamily)
MPTMPILISRYGDAVHRTAYGITRSRGAAEDVAQEVFLRAWSRGGFDAGRGSLQGWLQMMTRHTAIDWVRSETARRRRTEHVGAMEPMTTPAPDDETDASSVATRVRAAVADLPAAERDAVTLAYFGGLTYREVAERLGVPQGTVKSQIRRALLHLGAVLKLAVEAAS